VDDNTLIGMGSIVLNGAHIGKNCIVGAGSLVTQNKEFPEGSLILGSPARVLRKLTDEEIEGIHRSADLYVELAKENLTD
jgi:carbonic anhydrase/acetyltransferase-like protein (isoleucine patch superfamily)